MTDRPSAGELATAVREFLETEILPTVCDQRLRFRTLIAMNALSIVERESAPAQPPDSNYVELARRIRAGDIRQGDLARLEQSVKQKLLIASPSYLERYQDNS
jgi:hypothetical protein